MCECVLFFLDCVLLSTFWNKFYLRVSKVECVNFLFVSVFYLFVFLLLFFFAFFFCKISVLCNICYRFNLIYNFLLNNFRWKLLSRFTSVLATNFSFIFAAFIVFLSVILYCKPVTLSLIFVLVISFSKCL